MKIFGTHDERTIRQLQTCAEAEDDTRAVLCADGHVGYSMPIGGVVGYPRHVSPSGVGYDIACGNMAVQTDLHISNLTTANMRHIADDIQRRVSFGVGRKNNEPVDAPVLDAIAQSPIAQQRALAKMAADQLGTVGSGNHYVDVLEDGNGFIWVAVHFGSRGFGHKTATGFMNVAQGRAFEDGKGEGETDSPPLLLSSDSAAGEEYISAMHLAGEYAYEGRRQVVSKVVDDILKSKVVFSVHNHHNFAWAEEHDGKMLWVVRKGATPAFPGQFGFVGGSMGDISVILRGIESPESKEALYSTVHGAGRVMSRTQAAGKQRWTKAKWTCGDYRNCTFQAPIRDYERKKGDPHPKCPKCGNRLLRSAASMERLGGGLVDFDAEKAKLSARGIILRGAGADEAPPVYRPLADVLQAQGGTVEVLHVLQPRIVVMAGSDEFDPFKD